MIMSRYAMILKLSKSYLSIWQSVSIGMTCTSELLDKKHFNKAGRSVCTLTLDGEQLEVENYCIWVVLCADGSVTD